MQPANDFKVLLLGLPLQKLALLDQIGHEIELLEQPIQPELLPNLEDKAMSNRYI